MQSLAGRFEGGRIGDDLRYSGDFYIFRLSILLCTYYAKGGIWLLGIAGVVPAINSGTGLNTYIL